MYPNTKNLAGSLCSPLRSWPGGGLAKISAFMLSSGFIALAQG